MLLSVICGSCAKDFSLDTGERVVVVECILSSDSVQTLRLFYSHAKDDAQPTNRNIDKAEVELFDETENMPVGHFGYTGENWLLDYATVPEHSYRLEIDIEGHDKISARQTMPKQVKAVGGVHQGGPFSNNAHYHKYGLEFCGTTFSVRTIPANTWIYALAYDEKTGETHIADEICTDYPHVDNLFLTGDTYEPYRVEFQIKDKGILPVMICSYLQGYPLYRRFIRTDADLVGDEDQAESFIVSGSFYDYDNPQKEQPLGSKGGIVFCTVSEDYDRYLRDAIHYKQQQEESDDMTTIYIRDNIFSNIKGGVGIFGAKTEHKTDWVMTYSLIGL